MTPVRALSTHDEPAGIANGHATTESLRRELEALRRSESLLRDFIETSAIGLHWVSSDGTILWANQAELDLVGATQEEYLGHNITAFHADQDVINDILMRLRQGETLRDYPARLQHRDGSLRHVRISSSALFEHGEFVHTRCFTRDVTELVQEQERREQQQAAEFADTQLLQEISAELIAPGDEHSLYEKIVNAARSIMRSDFATMQVLRQDREELHLLASRGLTPEGAKVWEWVGHATDSTCGQALRTGKRSIADDVTTCAYLAGTPGMTALLEAGIHAAQSTPLVSRTGTLLGMISSHWRNPHAPTARDLRLLDILARQAADLLEQRQVQGVLRTSEEGYKATRLLLGAIVESSDDAIISKDLNGVITSWNQSAERMFGYTAEEAVGKTVASLLIPPDRQEEEPQILARLRRGERMDHIETIRRKKDGSVLDISLTISPVRDEHGQIVGASKIARDITQRKAYEKRVAEQAHLLDLTGDAILVRDGQDRILEWNRAAEQLYGFTREEALGKVSHDLLRTEFPEPLADLRAALLRDGQWSGALSHASRSGVRIATLSRWVAERDGNGDVTRILESNNDITGRVRMENALRAANLDLEHFAYSASHDLQEPLRSVKIFSQLLAGRCADQLDPESQEFLGNIREGAERMEQLVHDLLTYTQVATVDAEPEAVDANLALQSALANLAGAIEETGATVTADLLPSVRVHLVQLQQLFQNLVGNAIKYHRPEVPPVVHVTARPVMANWEFSITDNGIGIRPQFFERIFGLFKRLHNRNEYSGTGIGLALCRRIVERQQGRIWVESTPREGSTFYFTLPS
jgi:PAS domain S-box-containing protein